MRKLIGRVFSGILAVYMIAHGVLGLGLIHIGNWPVLRPGKSIGIFMIGGMFALYALKGISFDDVLRNAKPENKKIIARGSAIAMLVAGVGYFVFGWFPDEPTGKWGALFLILMGLLGSWLSFKSGR